MECPPCKTLESWYAILPERQAGLGQRKMQGSVCVRTAEAGTEYISVPASAARALAKIQKSEDVAHLDYGDVIALVERTTRRTAQDRIVRMISRREHSRKEVAARLRDEGFSRDVIHDTVKHAASIGLISDERFATSFIRGKIASGWGMERIERELEQRGINPSEVEGWPFEYLNPDDEYERALDAASRKRIKEPNAYGKLMRFLVGRGFSYDVSTRVTKTVLNKHAYT